MIDNFQEEELEQWRRTHYSHQIEGSSDEIEVTVMGWISSIRDHGNIRFIMIRDLYGEIQITVKKKEVSEEIFEKAARLREHSSVAIRGRKRPQAKAPNGVEIVPNEVRVYSLARKPVPFAVQSKSSVGIDTRLDLRALDLRRNSLQSIFHIRQTTLRAVRDFFHRDGFIEVSTPKMISTATEGGAALFPIFYYDREAFLAQSPQLYKEQLTMAFDSIFEIGPIFRAEPSRTNRHLSEATSIDIEKAFVDYNDIMDIIERMILSIIDHIKENNSADLDYLDIGLPRIEVPFPRFSYTDLIEKIQASGERIKWGDDITPNAMKEIQEERLKGFYFVIDWPTAAKPFYVKQKIREPKVCESFDLMYGPLEISSGSTRIHIKEHLLERMKQKSLNIEAFDYHLRVFDYGVPPHAGFGIGLERMLMSLIGIENIRDATLYPRDIDRLTP